MLTDYTTYADIRAALGVTEDDLEDSTLALTLYSDYLVQELEDVALTLPAKFAEVKAKGSPTEAETRFLSATRLFSTFAVAKQLTAALPLFAAKQLGDGKATVQRFESPYRDTIKTVNDQYGRTRNRLIAALEAITTTSGTTVARQYFAVVSPSTDPVKE